MLSDDRADPEEIIPGRMGEDRLLGLIRETLKPLERQAIRLRCVGTLPVDEITRIPGITDSTGARSPLQHSRRKLRAARGRLERNERGGRR